MEKHADLISGFALVLMIIAGCRYLHCHTVPENLKPTEKPAFNRILNDLDYGVIESDVPLPEILVEGNSAGLVFAVETYPLLPTGLDLNSADQTLLTLIHGIGLSRAARIIEERDRNGCFICPDDFTRRTGVNVNPYRKWVKAGGCENRK